MTSAVLSGRDRFKQHLRKVGSGEHTSKGMSREEAADAMGVSRGTMAVLVHRSLKSLRKQLSAMGEEVLS